MRRLIPFFILILLFPRASWAREGYCFGPYTSLKEVSSYIQTILLPQDKIYLNQDDNCLEVQIGDDRLPLLESWVRAKYKPTKHYGQDTKIIINSKKYDDNGALKSCRLKLERKIDSSVTSHEGKFGRKNNLAKTTVTEQGSRTSSLLLGLGKTSTIRVNDEKVELTCKSSGNGRYTVEVALSGLNHELSTTVQLSGTQKINLGNIVEKIKRKAHKIDTSKGASVSNTKGQKNYQYFLWAD